ncbi:Plectin-like protein, partial [Globisporangium splendens]
MKELQAKQHEDELVDDEPPLLLDEEDADDHHDNQIEDKQQREEPSLMDEMVAIAPKLKRGDGLKKGFFNTPKSAMRSKVSNQKQTSKTQSSSSKTQKKLPTRRPADREAARARAGRNVVVLRVSRSPGRAEEHEPAGPKRCGHPSLQLQSELANMLTLTSLLRAAWMNAKFFEKLAKHPHLALAMSPWICVALQNPRFTQATEDLQRDPQSAVLKYRKDEAVSKMLQDFVDFLGSHFEELGKEQEAAMKKHQQAQQESQQQPSSLLVQPSQPSYSSTLQTKADSTQPAIVDMDEVRREAIANMARSPDEEAQVQRILKNPELLQALSDTELMQRLQRCRECPQELRRLQEDPTLGPKLKLLVDAHLVVFQ